MSYVGVAPDQQIPLYRKEYTSPEQTITSGGGLTLAHGLGVKPTDFLAYIVCKTAEAGYSVGEEVIINPAGNDPASGTNRLIGIIPDATNLVIIFGTATATITIGNKSSGIAQAMTNANWRLVIRAWAEPAPTVPWANASLGQDGYWKDQNTGMIIQWGRANFTTGGTAITFPIVFPNAAFSLTFGSTSGINSLVYASSLPTTTGFTGFVGTTNSNATWMAIGY